MGEFRDFSGNEQTPGKFRYSLTAVALGLFSVVVVLGVANFFGWLKPVAHIGEHFSNSTGTVFKSALAAVPALPKLEEPLNVLVMGVDWNGKDAERYQGTRSDTMMLVSLNPLENRVGIISIPRDTRVTLGRHGCSKINQAHAIGGAEMAVRTVSENFNVPIDNYVVVDTAGLKDLFKLLGPVEVVVEKEMHYEDKTSGLHIDLKPGKQLLTAEQAEGYVRFRKDAMADIGRTERQQWFLRQALKKVNDPAVLLKAPELLKVGYDCVKTDLPLDKIARIMSFSKDLPPGSIVTSTLPGDGSFIEGVNYFILDEKGAEAVFERLAYRPEETQHFRRRHYEPVCDEETLKKKTRICIKFPESSQEEADALSEKLEENGWRVRQIVTSQEEECLHPRLDLHNRKATTEVISLIRHDLPEVTDFPAVLHYGGGGGDIAIVLPGTIHSGEDVAAGFDDDTAGLDKRRKADAQEI